LVEIRPELRKLLSSSTAVGVYLFAQTPQLMRGLNIIDSQILRATEALLVEF